MRRGLALFFAIALSCKGEPAAGPEPDVRCNAVDCLPSGIPREACAEGFVGDGSKGCAAVLPDAECTGSTFAYPGIVTCASAGVDVCPTGFALRADGGCQSTVPPACEGNTITVLGSEVCEPIAKCGSERYPATATPAVFVDAAYTGTDSDGSADKPFARLADALAKVDPTRRSIALAAGKYEFASRIDVPVEIVGACQETVIITAPKSSTTPTIETFADVTLRNVNVAGHDVGISVERGTTRVIASRVHGSGKEGIIVRAGGALELDRTVVSYATGAGVSVESSVATIKNSEIRSTALLPDGSGGTGVGTTTVTKKAARVTIERSVLSHNARYGVFARGAELTIRDSLVADTSIPKGVDGAAVIAFAGLVPTHAKLSGVTIERATGIGIGAFDGTIELDRTTIRETRASETGAYALNFAVDPTTRKPVVATVTRTLVSDSDDHGLFVKGATVDIGATILRRTRPVGAEPSGRAIVTQRLGSLAPILTVHDTLIEDAAGAGVAVTAGNTTLERVAIRKIKESPEKRFGMGAVAYVDSVAHRPTLTMRRTLIEDVLEAGAITFGARLEIESTAIRRVGPRESVGFFGHGVHFSYDSEHELAADGFVRGSEITKVLEAGINVFMSNVDVDTTTIKEVSAGSHELYGDGVTVASVNFDVHHPASVSVRRSHISGVARAAISVFEADAVVAGLLSRCNRIDIAMETVVGKQESKLRDEGENFCGCDAFVPCRATTANVTPIGVR